MHPVRPTSRARTPKLALRTAMASIAALAALPGVAGAASTSVGVHGDYFSPANVSIVAGDTVTWNWADDGHNVKVSGPESFTGPFRNTGGTERRTFRTAGSYTFVCEAHASKMRGTISVAAAPAPDASPSPSPSPSPSGDPSTASPNPLTSPISSNTDQPPSLSGPGLTTTTTSTSPAGEAADTVAPTVTGRVLRSGAVSVRLKEAARVTIRIRRGQRVVRTMRRSLRAGEHRIRVARGLRAGRYAVSVVARDRAGNDSAASKLKLVVR